jgi:hypothetical protein
MTTPHSAETPVPEPTFTVPPPALCGRPTRSGRPCRQRISDPRFEVACRTHATGAENEMAAVRRTAYYDGYRDGQGSAREFARFRIEQLQARIDRLESESKPPLRTTDQLGRQIVQVGQHAYAWDGPEPLAVGDQVWLPENYVSRMKHGPGRYRGEVTALGTDYTGHLSLILDRA